GQAGAAAAAVLHVPDAVVAVAGVVDADVEAAVLVDVLELADGIDDALEPAGDQLVGAARLAEVELQPARADGELTALPGRQLDGLELVRQPVLVEVEE